jgi:DNA-binding protein
MEEDKEIENIEEEEEIEEKETAEEEVEKTIEKKKEEATETPKLTTETPKLKRATKDDNVVFIGKKGIMSYVLAVVTQFNNGEREVVIKARGRAISRAVDVAEIVRQRFVKDVEPTNIDIATEEIEGDEGLIKVSAIEITLAK